LTFYVEENDYTVISFRLDNDILELLDKVAEAREVSRSAVIRQAILEFLARLSYLPDEKKKALGNFLNSNNFEEGRGNENKT